MAGSSTGAFGPVVVRRRLGATLRRLREASGLRLDQVAAELEWSASKVSRMETGHAVAKTWDVRNLLSVYGVEDESRRAEILRWVEESKHVAWWHPFSDASPTDLDYYVSLETEAAYVSQFCPVIPGLLQTPEYARAALTAMLVDVQNVGGAELDGLVEVRMGRQDALRRTENPLHFSAVIDESALLRGVGSEEIRTAQLARLLEPGDNVDLRVRPLSAPIRRFALSPFAIFTPRLSTIDPTIVNIEASGRDYYVEESSEVMEFQAAFSLIWSDSLSADQGFDLIRSLLR